MKTILLLAALGAIPSGAIAASAPRISQAWARASLPGQDNAAAYAVIHSDAGDTLLSVRSDDGQAMLHKTTRQGGMSDMQDVDSLALPAGQDVALAPGGTHIMLMGLPHRLHAGDTLHLTFHFARAGDERIDVPVRPVRATGP